VSASDVALLQRLSGQIVLPKWSVRCNRIHPDCRQQWDKTLAPIVHFPVASVPGPERP
jgi:hypothetical protein